MEIEMRECYLPHALNIMCSIWGVVVFFFLFPVFLLFLTDRHLVVFIDLILIAGFGVSSAMKPPVHS